MLSKRCVFAEMSIGNEKCIGRPMKNATGGKEGELVVVNVDLNCLFQDLARFIFKLFLHANHSFCESFAAESFSKLIDKKGEG